MIVTEQSKNLRRLISLCLFDREGSIPIHITSGPTRVAIILFKSTYHRKASLTLTNFSHDLFPDLKNGGSTKRAKWLKSTFMRTENVKN